jgi:hypothetical protein
MDMVFCLRKSSTTCNYTVITFNNENPIDGLILSIWIYQIKGSEQKTISKNNKHHWLNDTFNKSFSKESQANKIIKVSNQPSTSEASSPMQYCHPESTCH